MGTNAIGPGTRARDQGPRAWETRAQDHWTRAWTQAPLQGWGAGGQSQGHHAMGDAGARNVIDRIPKTAGGWAIPGPWGDDSPHTYSALFPKQKLEGVCRQKVTINPHHVMQYVGEHALHFGRAGRDLAEGAGAPREPCQAVSERVLLAFKLATAYQNPPYRIVCDGVESGMWEGWFPNSPGKKM